MARRKRDIITDDDLDSSGGSDEEGEEGFAGGDYDDEEPDERAERLRWSDPYGRKRKRGNGKEDALYGIWAEEGDDDGYGGKGKGRGGNANKNLRKTQSFVPSTTSVVKEENAAASGSLGDADIPAPTEDQGKDSSSGSDMDDSDGSDSSEEEEKPRIPRNREEEEELDTPENENVLAPAMEDTPEQANKGRGGIGTRPRGGIGARPAGGGIGSMARAAMASSSFLSEQPANLAPPDATSTPPAGELSRSVSPNAEVNAAAAVRERRSFLGSGTASSSGAPGLGAGRKPPVAISKDEQKHFSKLASQGGFGYKLLAKMGWQAGAGLGAQGEGIVTPIESKLRPKAMGIAYDGFKERTKQSQQEEKRRKGETAGSDEDDEDEFGRKKKGKKDSIKAKQKKEGEANQSPPAWKQPKARKAKVQHMTYEEIVASTSAGTSQAGVGAIFDLTGKQLTTEHLSSGVGMSHLHDVPTSDSTRLPELRHNLSIIVDTTKTELDNFAREAKAVEERRRWLSREEEKVRSVIEEDGQRIARLELITKVTSSIQKLSSSLVYDPRPTSEQIDHLYPSFDELLSTATEQEYELYRLDEVVVGAIAPILKKGWAEWEPLSDPTAFLKDLRKLKKMLRLQRRDVSEEEGENGQMQVDLFNRDTGPGFTARQKGKKAETQMTAFEALLWTQWMPRLRSAINNEWSPSHAGPVIELFSAWKSSGLLPRFISDNILDQLILPKISKAIEDWTPARASKRDRNGSSSARTKDAASLHHIVFPWLEQVGEGRMEAILDEAKRKVRGWLKSWRPRDGLPEGLEAWKGVILSSEWDNLLLQSVVPLLSAHLREKFSVNPREQDLQPLSLVMSFRPLLRASVLSQILETEFFPKFLDTLYAWLVSASVNYEQVAEWYKWWRKQVFDEEAGWREIKGVERGFARALDLMNQAMALGEDAKYRLKRPEKTASLPSNGSSRSAQAAEAPTAPRAAASRHAIDESTVTFRSAVEEYLTENDLLMQPTGRSDRASGMLTFRVSRNVDGKSGTTIYLKNDVVYMQEGGDTEVRWKPVGLQELVERGRKGSR